MRIRLPSFLSFPVVLFSVTAMVLGVLLVGCRPTTESVPAKIKVRQGANQLARPGEACSQELILEVLGPLRHGALGGSARRLPVSGVRLTLASRKPTDGLVAHPSEVVTDPAGQVRARVTPGPRPGDQYLLVTCPDTPDPPFLTVHFVSGVQVSGADQETIAGDELPEPIRVHVFDKNGEAQAGVPVHFSLSPSRDKAKLVDTRAVTDANGVAMTQLRTDSHRTGDYHVVAEIVDPERGLSFRSFYIRALAVNRLGLIIGILGGLGIFIFGMKLMSDGLQQIAGDRLKAVLQFFTRNRVTAMFAGLVVTALIQSSSACTVMVVGFVNAGLLSLTQSIGIIFGAAIGTTVTGQMVSFKLDGLALPCIVIGVAIVLVAKKSYGIGLGNTILGFGLLFFGMKMMSSDLKTLSVFPSFVRFFHTFDCQPALAGGAMPIGATLGAVAVGTAMTMIVQSSSATIGLAIALAGSGLINFYTAVPLILGDNIGTTITAILASIGTNRNARRAALANTLFKVLGVIIMLGVFYVRVDGTPVFLLVVNKITAGNVFAEQPENIGRHVAAAHTLFNILNVILFLPFVGAIGTICRFFIPMEKDGDTPILLLEPHLLNQPSLAIQQTMTALRAMSKEACRLSDHAVEAFVERDLSEREKLSEAEDRIDQYQHDIMQYLVKLNRKQLSERHAAAIPVIMHCVNDVERVGDRAINILELAEDGEKLDQSFSVEAKDEIREISHRIQAQGDYLTDCFETGSVDAMNRALKVTGEIKELVKRAERYHEKRLRSDECSVKKGIIFVDVLSNMGRIADHLGNLAERSSEMFKHHLEYWPPPNETPTEPEPTLS